MEGCSGIGRELEAEDEFLQYVVSDLNTKQRAESKESVQGVLRKEIPE